MTQDTEVSKLQNRITELEEKIEHLRFSRRVLMNLIERLEKEKCCSVSKLEQENKKLQTSNVRFAKWLLSKNRQIVLLEEKLRRKHQPASQEGGRFDI